MGGMKDEFDGICSLSSDGRGLRATAVSGSDVYKSTRLDVKQRGNLSQIFSDEVAHGGADVRFGKGVDRGQFENGFHVHVQKDRNNNVTGTCEVNVGDAAPGGTFKLTNPGLMLQ